MKKNATRQETDLTDQELYEFFHETDDEMYSCIYCFKHSKSPAVPEHLKKLNKGHFGIFKMPNSENSLTNKERRKRMSAHTKSDLHNWCVEQDKIEDMNAKIKHESEVKGSEIIVTSAVQCIKELDGSLKFVRTNNLLEILNEHFPTKNDGRQMFFTVRDLFFEKICRTIQQNFQSIKSVLKNVR